MDGNEAKTQSDVDFTAVDRPMNDSPPSIESAQDYAEQATRILSLAEIRQLALAFSRCFKTKTD